ncbi:protocatechuate 3,4-dioxygenase alpha subunit [Rubricella aquisinus]|uniref:Protocatechuate 3,4-dioxygenase alpha subunit n=1 Tax=Rubricella aquisinus TaxID=2028108 RepID=A0A840X5M2_9RHOB|nr:protocatechuate 3,4-dioxygenase subunit alpha [Rubricella aquisinus]MBB5517125.1 protocatechuate 3,4-dioxygenase alpha subunit [Rubricella aquisinus]
MKETASQTAGPYVHIGCVPSVAGLEMYRGQDLGAKMLSPDVTGERITLHGVIHDGSGAPVTDAMIEIWQADAEGRFDNPAFLGWGRQATDAQTGAFRFDTILPGPVTQDDGTRHAPHILMWIVARGINLGLMTRVYFDDGPDPVLDQVPAARRQTLIAQRDGPKLRFDVHLQGAQETVFFDV